MAPIASPLRVAVVGATGLLGRHVVPRLIERGHTVRAAVRDAGRALPLAAAGAELVTADILDGASLSALVQGCDAVVHVATAVPRPGAPPEWPRNDAIRREGTALLLRAARQAGVQRIVAQGIVLVHAGAGAAWIHEDSPLHPSPITQSALDMERVLRESALDFRILRGGLFYGPGSGREDVWRDAARAGTLRLPGSGEDYLSLIHPVDMARAVVAAVEADAPRSTLLVVDDVPVTARELLGFIAAREGAAPPESGGPPGFPSLRASNARARQALAWSPCYPTYRAGLA